jgi:hypothetical protein
MWLRDHNNARDEAGEYRCKADGVSTSKASPRKSIMRRESSSIEIENASVLEKGIFTSLLTDYPYAVITDLL